MDSSRSSFNDYAVVTNHWTCSRSTQTPRLQVPRPIVPCPEEKPTVGRAERRQFDEGASSRLWCWMRIGGCLMFGCFV